MISITVTVDARGKKGMDTNDQSKIAQTVLSAWGQTMQYLSIQFGISEQPAPQTIVFASDLSGPGTLENEQTLILNRRVIEYGLVREASTWLSLYHILKNTFACDTCAKDLATEIGQVMTSATGKRMRMFYETFELDRNNSPLHRIALLSGKNRNLEVIKEVITIAQDSKRIFPEQYRSLLEQKINETVPYLSEDDLLLLKQVLISRTTKIKDISDGLSRPQKWCLTRIGNLQKRGIISLTTKIKFSAIGIREFIIFLGLAEREIFPKIISILQKSPFIESIDRVLSGPWSFIARLYVPDNEFNHKAVTKFVDQMRHKFNVETEAFDVATQGDTASFRFYSTTTNQWEIPWNLLEAQLARINTDRLGRAFPKVMQTVKDYRREITPLDIAIIGCVQQGITTVKDLRVALRVGQNRLAKRIRWLRQTGILTSHYQLQYLGLSETLTLVSEDQTTANNILAWTQILPSVHHSTDINDRLVTSVRLPQGGAVRAALTLNRCSQPFYMALSLNHSTHSWQVPQRRWNPSTRCWLPDNDKIESWLRFNI